MKRNDLAVRPSAHAWLRAMMVSAVVCAPATAALIAVGVATGGTGLAWGAVIAVWFVLVIVAGVVLPIVAIIARNAELRAGYITLAPGFVNVRTVNPKTGEVLREAGEPLLTAAQFAKALQSSNSQTNE